ncbi:hypothetical protein [Halalkalibaculum roseum]|nr:hypothetical protein [Halalkalibaculum roseum]
MSPEGPGGGGKYELHDGHQRQWHHRKSGRYVVIFVPLIEH